MLTRMGRFSMAWQLFLVYGLLVAVTLGLLGWIVGGWVQRHAIQGIEERLQGESLLLQEIVRGRDLEALRPQLQTFQKHFGLRITLIDANGNTLFESDPDDAEARDPFHNPEVAAARNAVFGVATRPDPVSGKPMRFLARRVEPAAHDVAYVRVALPLNHIEQHAADLRRLVWIMGGFTIIIAFGLAWWLAQRVTAPIRDLTAGTNEIAAGDYGHKVYLDRTDEFGVLATSFNHMSQHLATQFSQLEQDRQQLRAVLGSMVEGVIAVDAEQNILFANERAGQLLDFAIAQAVGRKLWEVVRHRPVHDLVGHLLEDAKGESESLDWTGLSNRSLTVHAAHLPGEPVSGAVLVFHDITELRRLERLRQDFVANVSHELKTPLSVIVACVETLQSGAIDDVEHRGKFLERIATQANRLLALIIDLLSLARVEAGTEAMSFQAVSLEEAVQACLERHQERAKAKHQRLELVPPAHPPTTGVVAWADEDALSHILDNLVDNAIKYTPDHGTIQMHWWEDDGKSCIEVRDTGLGIPDAELPRIFERFYRVDKARSRELGGTGLGLSIVKHLAQAMSGTVRATSDPGKGCTFTVTLPRSI